MSHESILQIFRRVKYRKTSKNISQYFKRRHLRQSETKMETFLLPNMIELFETNRMSHFLLFYDDLFL